MWLAAAPVEPRSVRKAGIFERPPGLSYASVVAAAAAAAAVVVGVVVVVVVVVVVGGGGVGVVVVLVVAVSYTHLRAHET